MKMMNFTLLSSRQGKNLKKSTLKIFEKFHYFTWKSDKKAVGGHLRRAKNLYAPLATLKSQKIVVQNVPEVSVFHLKVRQKSCLRASQESQEPISPAKNPQNSRNRGAKGAQSFTISPKSQKIGGKNIAWTFATSPKSQKIRGKNIASDLRNVT